MNLVSKYPQAPLLHGGRGFNTDASTRKHIKTSSPFASPSYSVPEVGVTSPRGFSACAHLSVILSGNSGSFLYSFFLFFFALVVGQEDISSTSSHSIPLLQLYTITRDIILPIILYYWLLTNTFHDHRVCLDRHFHFHSLSPCLQFLPE